MWPYRSLQVGQCTPAALGGSVLMCWESGLCVKPIFCSLSCPVYAATRAAVTCSFLPWQ